MKSMLDQYKLVTKLLKCYNYHAYLSGKKDSDVKLFDTYEINNLSLFNNERELESWIDHYEFYRYRLSAISPGIYNRHQFYMACLKKITSNLSEEEFNILYDSFSEENKEIYELLKGNNSSSLQKIFNKFKKRQ